MSENARLHKLERLEQAVQVGGIIFEEIALLGSAGATVPTEINLKEVKPIRQGIDDGPPGLAPAADAMQHDHVGCARVGKLGDKEGNSSPIDDPLNCRGTWDLSHDRFLTRLRMSTFRT